MLQSARVAAFTVSELLSENQQGRGRDVKFPPVTSTNVGISPQNFLTFHAFSFNLFTKMLRLYHYEPHINSLEPRPPLKKSVFSGQIFIKLSL